MADHRPLTDDDAHDRLVRAHNALGIAPGASIHANAALVAARQSLLMLQYALVAASEKASGELPD